MEQKNLFDQQVCTEVLNRIEKVTAETSPHWGKMDAAQMMAHCAEILHVSNGKPLKNTPFLAKLFKGYIRKMVVGPKPYAKSTKTHPQYLQTSKKEFEQEKQNLLGAINKMRELEDTDIKHPLFGSMTRSEKGWAMYKHLDHHLTQFGV